MNRKRIREPLFSMTHHCPYHYNSNMFLSTATKKRYVLEEYPAPVRGTTGYNPLYDPSQPIPPPDFNQQFQDNRQNIYDRPFAHHFDDRQHIPWYNRNVGMY